MSDLKKEVFLIEQLKQQHAAFISQRDQAQANFNQLVGAIYACELMIKKHEEEMIKIVQENSEGQENGEIINETTE